jgi:hypothetical protein
MRFYADENFPLATVVELRRLGHDVLTAFEDGRANKQLSDELVLARSTKLSRMLLTINRKDFKRLHNTTPEHSGILICKQDPDPRGQASRIHDACSSKADVAAQLIRIYRPSTPR